MADSRHARDTTVEADRAQILSLRMLGLEGRARLTFELCDAAKETARAGIRHRHPGYSDRELGMALLRLTVGDEFFEHHWPGCRARP